MANSHNARCDRARKVTLERLREVLDYDPTSGIFRWKVQRPGGAPKAGSIAGCANYDGYRQIKIDGISYLSHVLAFLYMTGKWPSDQIDHVNCDRSDNRFENLREATNGQNGHNRKMAKNNTSGMKGVSWSKSECKWRADVRLNKIHHFLGYFDDITTARKAYEEAALRFHGEFSRTE